MSEELGITVKKDKLSEWYQQVIAKARFADYSPVKGAIVIMHWGYGIWEAIQEYWDAKMKEHGVKNYYFPLLIPENLLKREADHFEGFVPEVAWVTMAGENKLDERLAIRPTSETIIYDAFSKWINSHRDLPLRTNQWCNIVRWETKMTKPFIRGREFLWHEAHTVHATEEETDEEARWAIEGYARMAEELLAMPVLIGKKTESDKFAGADRTYAIEAFMPDGKALQMGTSHMLGQNFAKPYNVRFVDENEKWQYAWQTSWGISTRMIGGIIMVHGDDKGAILPPRVAPTQIVIVPIMFKGKDASRVLEECRKIKEELKDFKVELDERDYTAGWKFNHWEVKGVPLRIEIGPRDIKEGKIVIVRRDTGEKEGVSNKDVKKTVGKKLEEIQKALFERAKKKLESLLIEVSSVEALKKAVAEGKAALIEHCGHGDCEKELEEKTEGGPRVIPFGKTAKGKCINCSKTASYCVYWGKSY